MMSELTVDVTSVGVVVIFVLTIVLTRKCWLFSSKEDEKLRNLVKGLASAGGDTSAKVVGRVEVQIRGSREGAAAVCLVRELNVMYWWRAVGSNGHALIGGMGSVEETVTRGAIAAVRLWGKAWGSAERVDIFIPGALPDKLTGLLNDQIEDCQNKYGVRISQSTSPGEGGARELVDQLVAGRGVGQQHQGLNNTNLRVAENLVYQLVDHSALLSRHFFDI